MFRLKGAPEVDPIIEKQKVRASVKNNVLIFVGLCAAIRIGKKTV